MNGEADPSFPASLLATVLALALVLVIAWFAIRLLARVGYGGAPRRGGRLKVLQSVGLGARERLVLVSLDDREYLLGVAANAITVIERDAARDASDPGPATGAPPDPTASRRPPQV